MMMLVCLLRQKFKKLRFQMIDDNICQQLVDLSLSEYLEMSVRLVK